VRQGIRRTFEAEPDLEIVGEVDNGREAVNLARELSPDAIIIDARLPKLDSVEVVRRIKEEHPQVSVLVFTACEEEEYIVGLVGAGVTGYLLKSTKCEELAQAIRLARAGKFVCELALARRLFKRVARLAVAVNLAEHLTRRETEVLKLVTKGMSNRDIADYLGLTEGTVKAYLANILGKMGVHSRTEAVREALKRGWVSLDDG
jgi:DNA-binding NarL/FixJ family response regulator